MAADPGVRYVEEDGLVEASSVESLDASSSWGLDRIDQRVIRKAGALAYNHLYRYAAVGAGVNVYVVDTGVRTTHVEFGGRAFAAFDARAYENVDGDCNGHGTHVAGIIGGSRVGVAKLVTLHSVRVLGCDGTGYVSDLVAGIDWIVANQQKPAVINMSIQALPNATFSDALRGAIAAGITFVAAAGNDSSDACFGLTGDVPDAIVVGASDIADSRAGFSNFGACVDLFAPGDAILSSWASDDSAYVYMRGTSQAAPHVAGAAALYLQREPDASPQQVASVILADATIDVIIVPGTGSPNRLLFTPQLGDTMPPRVSVIAPVPGGIVSGVQTVRVSAEDDVEIAEVVFYACGARIGRASLAPYSASWDSSTSPDGACSVDVQAVDLAGNVGAAHVGLVVANRKDAVPPRIEIRTDRSRLWPLGGLVPVTFTGFASDNDSTITEVWFTARDEYGRVQPSGVAAVVNGQFRITMLLEARRRGSDADGRRYVVTVTATDSTGNTASAAAGVLVPHDRR